MVIIVIFVLIITGSAGGSDVTVTCDAGYRTGGTTKTATCNPATLTFNTVTCGAQACASTQVANSEEA